MMNHNTKTKLLTALLAIGILVTSACQSIPVSIKGTDAETTTVNEETTLPAGTSEIVAEPTVKPTTEPTKATTKATTAATTTETTAATTKAPTPTEKPAPTETTVQPTQTTAAPPPTTTAPPPPTTTAPPPPPETTAPPPPPETTAPPATEPPPTTEAPPPTETTPAPTKFREDPDVIREGIIQYCKDNNLWNPDGEVRGGGSVSYSLGYHYSNQEYIDAFIRGNIRNTTGVVSVSSWIENDWIYIAYEQCKLPES